MKAPYSYLPQQFANSDAILDDIKGLLEHGWYTFGPELEQFEQTFADTVGTKYALGVGSGTDALFLPLKAQGIGPGDEVITAANTFIATVGAIAATGATPVFADATDDYTLDVSQIENAITPRTKAILPVHYTGCAADMETVTQIAHRHGLLVIEDACQAIGARSQGRHVGTIGVASGFSLHPLKNLNVWGDGGVVVTDSEKMRDQINLLRNHGLANRDVVECFGYNSRLDTLQAIVGNHRIKDIDWINERRIRCAETYNAAFADLSDLIRTPPNPEGNRHVYHIYILEVTDRDDLLAYLHREGVDAKLHYPIPLHLQPACSHLGYSEGDFPISERQAKSVISLPVHQHLDDEQIDFVVDRVRRFYK